MSTVVKIEIVSLYTGFEKIVHHMLEPDLLEAYKRVLREYIPQDYWCIFESVDDVDCLIDRMQMFYTYIGQEV